MNLSPPFGVFDPLPDDGVAEVEQEPVKIQKMANILLFSNTLDINTQRMTRNIQQYMNCFSFKFDACFTSLAMNHRGVIICDMKETEHKNCQ
jgi:hypothetical protein